MKAIVAIDNSWGIGNNGELLFHIKEDMEFFKKMTIGKVVVMGRKTLESLPNGKPLKDRTNLVITSNKSYKSHDNVIFGDIDEINEMVKKDNTDDIFIIGGASIYQQFIHRCDTIYVTHNVVKYEADTYMPNLAFEGFVFNQIIDKGITESGNNWIIEEWITSESEPYKSVIWFNDSNNNTLFVHANDLNHWKGIYSNSFYRITKDFKKCLFKKTRSRINKMINVTKIHNYYRAEINASDRKDKLRFAAFGATKDEAWQNLMAAIISIY